MKNQILNVKSYQQVVQFAADLVAPTARKQWYSLPRTGWYSFPRNEWYSLTRILHVNSFTKSEWQSRPDADGKIVLSEANEWYRGNSGKPLFADASKINLSPVSVGDFKDGVGSSMYKNFASLSGNSETGLVYGTIRLTLTNSNGQVRLGSGGLLDKYDFDYQKGRTLRNIATWIGEKNAGNGTPFLIYNYGTGKVIK